MELRANATDEEKGKRRGWKRVIAKRVPGKGSGRKQRDSGFISWVEKGMF